MLEMADDSRDLEATGHSRFGVPSFFNRLVIPLHSLHKVSSETSYGHIVLTVKDTRVVVISSSLARVKGKKKSLLEDLVIMLQRLAFTGSMRQLKLFAFRKVSADSEEERRGYGAGWELTSLINDYARMGIPSCSEWTVH